MPLGKFKFLKMPVNSKGRRISIKTNHFTKNWQLLSWEYTFVAGMVIVINTNADNVAKHCLDDTEKTWNDYQ